MPREIKNVGATVRARLQNLSRETGQSFELILTRYALERLLYRIITSAFIRACWIFRHLACARMPGKR